MAWILAHGNGLDELVVLASGMALALAVRLLVAHRRTPDGPEEPPVSKQQPDPPAHDDHFDLRRGHVRAKRWSRDQWRHSPGDQ